MILLPKLRIIFQHVPKTGGSAVLAALRPFCHETPAPHELREVGEHRWQVPWHQPLGGMHDPWEVVAGRVAPLLNNGWLFCAAHRNPWDRFLSMHAKRGEGSTIDEFAATMKLRAGWWLTPAVEMGGPCATWWDYRHLQDELTAVFRERAPDLEPPALPIENVTEGRLGREYLTQYAITKVLEHFAADVEFFGYEIPQPGALA